MAAELRDDQLAEIERQINANPEILRALQQNATRLRATSGRTAGMYRDPVSGGVTRRAPAAGHEQLPFGDVLRHFGINIPDSEDYSLAVDPETGQLRLERHNFFQRNAEWIVPATIVGGGLAAGALTGGGAAAAGSGSTAAGTLPATTIGTGYIGPIAGGTGLAGVETGLAAGGAAAATGAAAGAGSSIANAVKDGANATNHNGNGNDTPSWLDRILNTSNQNQGTDWGSLLGILGSSVANGIAAGMSGQERQSFRGTKADPVDLLSGAQAQISGMAGPIQRRALTPATLSTPSTQDDLDSLMTSVSLLRGRR